MTCFRFNERKNNRETVLPAKYSFCNTFSLAKFPKTKTLKLSKTCWKGVYYKLLAVLNKRKFIRSKTNTFLLTIFYVFLIKSYVIFESVSHFELVTILIYIIEVAYMLLRCFLVDKMNWRPIISRLFFFLRKKVISYEVFWPQFFGH